MKNLRLSLVLPTLALTLATVAAPGTARADDPIAQMAFECGEEAYQNVFTMAKFESEKFPDIEVVTTGFGLLPPIIGDIADYEFWIVEENNKPFEEVSWFFWEALGTEALVTTSYISAVDAAELDITEWDKKYFRMLDPLGEEVCKGQIHSLL